MRNISGYAHDLDGGHQGWRCERDGSCSRRVKLRRLRHSECRVGSSSRGNLRAEPEAELHRVDARFMAAAAP